MRSLLKDRGDITVGTVANGAMDKVESHTLRILEEAGDNRIISLGGDHSITFPLIKAFSKKFKGNLSM